MQIISIIPVRNIREGPDVDNECGEWSNWNACLSLIWYEINCCQTSFVTPGNIQESSLLTRSEQLSRCLSSGRGRSIWKLNQVLETIIVIRPITGAILITDPPPPLMAGGNNDRSSGANDSLSRLVITRKCNSSIGNYPGVSFTVVIATNLEENAQHSLLSIICSHSSAEQRITVTQSELATIIHSNIWMTNMMRWWRSSRMFSHCRGNVCGYNSILWEI